MPLKDGVDDESYQFLFRPIMHKIMEVYQPGAIVLQSGAVCCCCHDLLVVCCFGCARCGTSRAPHTSQHTRIRLRQAMLRVTKPAAQRSTVTWMHGM